MTKQETIKVRIQRLTKLKEDFLQSIMPVNLKSEYPTCPECGSSIRKDLWNGLKCPACGAKKISPSAKDRLKSFDERLAQAKKDLKKELAKPVRGGSTIISSVNSAETYSVSFTKEYDRGYTSYYDQAMMIPCQMIKGKSGRRKFDGVTRPEPDNGYYPYFLIQHEEEEYGNDTHGWNAYLEYFHDGCYDFRYIASKELSFERALSLCQKWFIEHRDEIKGLIAEADRMTKQCKHTA